MQEEKIVTAFTSGYLEAIEASHDFPEISGEEKVMYLSLIEKRTKLLEEGVCLFSAEEAGKMRMPFLDLWGCLDQDLENPKDPKLLRRVYSENPPPHLLVRAVIAGNVEVCKWCEGYAKKHPNHFSRPTARNLFQDNPDLLPYLNNVHVTVPHLAFRGYGRCVRAVLERDRSRCEDEDVAALRNYAPEIFTNGMLLKELTGAWKDLGVELLKDLVMSGRLFLCKNTRKVLPFLIKHNALKVADLEILVKEQLAYYDRERASLYSRHYTDGERITFGDMLEACIVWSISVDNDVFLQEILGTYDVRTGDFFTLAENPNLGMSSLVLAASKLGSRKCLDLLMERFPDPTHNPDIYISLMALEEDKEDAKECKYFSQYIRDPFVSHYLMQAAAAQGKFKLAYSIQETASITETEVDFSLFELDFYGNGNYDTILGVLKYRPLCLNAFKKVSPNLSYVQSIRNLFQFLYIGSNLICPGPLNMAIDILSLSDTVETIEAIFKFCSQEYPCGMSPAEIRAELMFLAGEAGANKAMKYLQKK